MAGITFPELTSKFERLQNYTIGKLEENSNNPETGLMPHQHQALQLIAGFYLNKNGHGLIVMPTELENPQLHYCPILFGSQK